MIKMPDISPIAPRARLGKPLYPHGTPSQSLTDKVRRALEAAKAETAVRDLAEEHRDELGTGYKALGF